MGDLYDLFSYSKFSKRLFLTPGEEIETARRQAIKFWQTIQKISPKTKCFQLRGNHDERMAKRVLDKANWLDPFIDYTSLWEFPKVETIHDPRQVLTLYDWAFTHGHRKEGEHIEAVDFQNVCIAHTHRGGTWSRRFNRLGKESTLTELNCGYVADPTHEALIYRPLTKYLKWTPGVGIIDHHGGRFIAKP